MSCLRKRQRGKDAVLAVRDQRSGVRDQERPAAVVVVHALIVRREGEIICKGRLSRQALAFRSHEVRGLPGIRREMWGTRHIRFSFHSSHATAGSRKRSKPVCKGVENHIRVLTSASSNGHVQANGEI